MMEICTTIQSYRIVCICYSECVCICGCLHVECHVSSHISLWGSSNFMHPFSLRCVWERRIGTETKKRETPLTFYDTFQSLYFILKALSSHWKMLVREWDVRQTRLAAVLRAELRAEMVNRFSTYMPTVINW